MPLTEETVLATTKLDHTDTEYLGLLNDLQGNILTGHGRKFANHIFIRFKNTDLNVIKSGIADLAPSVTTAKQQLDDSNKEHTHVNFMISSHGYGFLKEGVKMPTSPKGSAKFKDGARHANNISMLNDPKPNAQKTQWQKEYNQEIHAMIIVADNDVDALEEKTTTLKLTLKKFTDILHVEKGEGLTTEINGVEREIEHFGYRDGISQPEFFKPTGSASGTLNWDPSAPLGLVLRKDPNGDDEAYGTFFVFRKLQQDKDKFDAQVHTVATKLGISDDLAGAYAVGRFKDGTPVLLSSTANNGNVDSEENNFNFDSDPDAVKCPFHSHIRKTNPRGDTTTVHGVPLEQEREHQIARRAIPYGPKWTKVGDNKERGLLFQCAQSSLTNGFFFQQSRWANAEGFVKAKTGVDPLVGQGATMSQPWPNKWGDKTAGLTDNSDIGDVSLRIADAVTMRGGEFFFVPSISGMTSLKLTVASEHEMSEEEDVEDITTPTPTS